MSLQLQRYTLYRCPEVQPGCDIKITFIHSYLQGDSGALSEVMVALQGQLNIRLLANKFHFQRFKALHPVLDGTSAYYQKLDNAKAMEHKALA